MFFSLLCLPENPLKADVEEEQMKMVCSPEVFLPLTSIFSEQQNEKIFFHQTFSVMAVVWSKCVIRISAT